MSLEDEKELLKVEVNAIREWDELLRHVLQIYAESISEHIAEKKKELEWLDIERGRVQEELDQDVQDLQDVEAAYADSHKKFEQTMWVVRGPKDNGCKQTSCLEGGLAELIRQHIKYERIKSRAEDTLKKANKEIDDLSGSQEVKVARLTATLKKVEMKAA